MMRRPAALLLALLAFAALPAAKPVPVDDGPGDGQRDELRERWRGQGISQCVATLRAVPELSPDDLESICGCAIDTYLERMGPAVTGQPVQAGGFPAPLRSQLISCTARIQPERMSDVARLAMGAPPAPVQPPAPVTETTTTPDDKPVNSGETGSSEGGSSGGLWRWLSTLSLPAWLTGASLLWWIAIGIFVFGLLILKFRRRDPRQDLSAPPSYMRKGVPPPPRRPDLPR